MGDFITGIDDFGTMSGSSQGWTFVSFDLSFYDDFKSNAQDILSESGLSSFHAKQFKRKKKEYYKKFLQLIRDTLAKGDSSMACATLLDESWKDDFRGFTERVIRGAFEKAGVEDNELISGSQFIAAPIFTYLRVATNNIRANSSLVHIDQHAITRGFSNIDLVINGHNISPQIPIVAALNEYRKRLFPYAPKIEQDSIKIMNDEESFMIQAADMIGNFSGALVFKELGKESKSNNLKAEIMNDVFGDILDKSNILNSVELQGDDFVLKQAGSFNFLVS